MRYQFAALAISGLAITGAIFINPGVASAKEASSGGKTTATAPATVNPGKTATNSGKNKAPVVKAPKYRP
jgi:hypothetical protein